MGEGRRLEKRTARRSEVTKTTSEAAIMRFVQDNCYERGGTRGNGASRQKRDDGMGFNGEKVLQEMNFKEMADTCINYRGVFLTL